MNSLKLIVCLIATVTFSNAQDISTNNPPNQFQNGFGIGFDVVFSSEPNINHFTDPPFQVAKPVHKDYLVNFSYNMKKIATVGFVLGLGTASNSEYNSIHKQDEYFTSRSGEIGVFCKHKLISAFNGKLSGYIQPIIRYRVIFQTTHLNNDNSLAGKAITGRQDITNFDFNLRFQVNYEIFSQFEAGFFCANDILARENIKGEYTFIESTSDWLFAKKILYVGFNLNYKFR